MDWVNTICEQFKQWHQFRYPIAEMLTLRRTPHPNSPTSAGRGR
jgi:hypothetical protein